MIDFCINSWWTTDQCGRRLQITIVTDGVCSEILVMLEDVSYTEGTGVV